MKASELAQSTRKTFLVYGDSGTGKTVFASGFPGPLHVFDFDGKISSAASFYRGSPQLDAIEYESYVEKDSFNKFFTKLKEFQKLSKEGKLPYKTLVLDSITTFADSLMAEVIRQNPGDSSKRSHVNETKVPHLKDYQIAISHVKDIMKQLLALPVNIVATAHIFKDKDETTGEILYQPLIWGKDLPSWLPLVFEEVYRTYTETKDGKTLYLGQTRSDRKFVSRTQLTKVPNPVRLEYNEVSKFF